jgi:hypothetical protein
LHYGKVLLAIMTSSPSYFATASLIGYLNMPHFIHHSTRGKLSCYWHLLLAWLAMESYVRIAYGDNCPCSPPMPKTWQFSTCWMMYEMCHIQISNHRGRYKVRWRHCRHHNIPIMQFIACTYISYTMNTTFARTWGWLVCFAKVNIAHISGTHTILQNCTTYLNIAHAYELRTNTIQLSHI